MALSQLHTRRRVEFADTDMAGLVHFARFFVFMETAEHQFLEAVGMRIHRQRDGREIGWPRVQAACEYLSPARLYDQLEIRVRVLRKGEKSMTYGFEFRLGERLVARGRMTSVCCLIGGPDGPRAIPIPPEVAGKIAEAPPEEADG